MDEIVKSKDAEPVSARKAHDELEKGLEDTFPASDPPASTQPGSRRDKPETSSPKSG